MNSKLITIKQLRLEQGIPLDDNRPVKQSMQIRNKVKVSVNVSAIKSLWCKIFGHKEKVVYNEIGLPKHQCVRCRL